jgi:hypothetical protein
MIKSETEIKNKLKDLEKAMNILLNFKIDSENTSYDYIHNVKAKHNQDIERLRQIQAEILALEWIIGERIISQKWSQEISLTSWEK